MNEIEAHKRTDAELQKAKEVAEAASKAKSRHVVGLSHELRTPLNAILGYAQLMERDPAIPQRATQRHQSGAPQRRASVRPDRRPARHFQDRGGQPASDAATRCTSATSSTRSSTCSACKRPPRASSSATSAPIGCRLSVQTDENRLRQILINLLSNAIKFTDAGHVTFQVDYRHQVAEFTVADTGVGIHKNDLERIFQPFERARTAGAKATIGTGLGLTITSLLTKIMGGDIAVQSEVGNGSTFRVKLFLSEVARPRIASTMEYRVRGYAGPRQTILVVDDNEVQRDLIRELLSPLGFNVVRRCHRTRVSGAGRRDQPEPYFARHRHARDGWLGGGAALAPPARQTRRHPCPLGQRHRRPRHGWRRSSSMMTR